MLDPIKGTILCSPQKKQPTHPPINEPRTLTRMVVWRAIRYLFFPFHASLICISSLYIYILCCPHASATFERGSSSGRCLGVMCGVGGITANPRKEIEGMSHHAFGLDFDHL